MTPDRNAPAVLAQNAHTNAHIRQLAAAVAVMFLALNALTAASVLYIVRQNRYDAERGAVLAGQSVRQATLNNRDILRYRRDFAQSRDCPIEYFRRLVEVSRAGGDITAVEPPCQAQDVGDLDRQLAEVEQRLAALDQQRTAHD